MNIYLIDFDGKIPNLALMRLSTYHKGRGDLVTLLRGNICPGLFDNPDKVYLSCIFKWSQNNALQCAQQWGAEIGGTGIDPSITLPDDILCCTPDVTLYPSTEAIGFISRGCIRNCQWCIVPQKEGGLHRVSTAQDIVGNFQEAKFLDNNFLALPDYQQDLEWVAKHQIKIDFNQGLDARLVTHETVELLSACKWSRGIRFSLDSEHQLSAIEKTIRLFNAVGYSLTQITVFVLIGFSSMQSDVRRLWALHKLGVRPFPMGFRDLQTGKELRQGWDRNAYQKYKRLICKIPFAKTVWEDFENELC